MTRDDANGDESVDVIASEASESFDIQERNLVVEPCVNKSFIIKQAVRRIICY